MIHAIEMSLTWENDPFYQAVKKNQDQDQDQDQEGRVARSSTTPQTIALRGNCRKTVSGFSTYAFDDTKELLRYHPFSVRQVEVRLRAKRLNTAGSERPSGQNDRL